MGIITVRVAAAASFLFGALWYMGLSKPWLDATGIEVDETGKPKGGSLLPFLLAGIAMLVVAGMMRHVFAMAGIDTAIKGLIGGLGVGAFFISPWIMINNAYGMRPFKLTLIDGGYATFGCGVIGLVLNLF
ncbi:DUF1761 domain-containing protein [Rhodobacteraceae bacterium D3-12]|nr:DUF1761 domain-containing protein [Rhodobacteraceae bacterium D3-12]